DPTVQLFHGPAFIHKTLGEIVEEFGMARRVFSLSLVAGRGGDASPEVPGPHALHDYSRGERGFVAGNGVCKMGAAVLEGFRICGKHRQELRRCFDAEIIRVTAEEHMSRDGLWRIFEGHGAGRESAVSAFRLPGTD